MLLCTHTSPAFKFSDTILGPVCEWRNFTHFRNGDTGCWERGTGAGFQMASAIYFLSTSGLPSQSLSVLLLYVTMQDAAYKSASESRPLICDALSAP